MGVSADRDDLAGAGGVVGVRRTRSPGIPAVRRAATGLPAPLLALAVLVPLVLAAGLGAGARVTSRQPQVEADESPAGQEAVAVRAGIGFETLDRWFPSVW